MGCKEGAGGFAKGG